MPEDDQPLQSVSRRTAKSGRVGYGDSVLLHESSRTRVLFVPFFIQHSDHTELASKIMTYAKQPAPFDWAIVDDKSVSLSEAATRRLLAGLRAHLAVTKENEDGSYLLIRVAEGTAHLGTHDPAEVAAALTKVLSQEEILTHLQNTELTSELAAAFRGAIRLSEMRAAVVELRTVLDQGINSEDIYQSWCEKHSWAFGNAYVVRDEVREISPGDHLDLLLPNVIAGYRDLVELKRPNMEVLRWDDTHRNYYFSADLSRALGQCHRYLDVLHEAAAKGLRDHPEIVAYHPRATIVIGRSNTWEEDKLHALHGLNRRLSGVTIMTYDHLLAQGERLVELLSPSVCEDESLPDIQELDDDIPF
ncbi:MAG: hypothetical protein JWN13_2095 [Betaproteobacteria bacterium]|nr:hypothetical protein [Betaproteobacteria bacterium]